jgi:predicted  nucleic acid-binding Zn-ribbon protein
MPIFNINVYHHEDAEVTRRLNQISLELSLMNEDVQVLNDNIEKLNKTVTSVAGVLTELKTKLDDAIAAGSLADLRAASEKLATITSSLRAVAVAVDPTPETPVE